MKINTRIILILVAAALLSVYTHVIVFDNFMMPTFGNTNIHVAIARHIVEKSNYPLQDYSYGGTARDLYVPLYRIFLAFLVIVTGWSFDFVSRMIVLGIAILLPLGFFLLGKKLFGENVGLISAFLASVPGELSYYTVRPLPQAVGLMLLPFAFYFLFKDSKWSFLFAFVLALLHQETAAFYGLVCLAYLFYKFYSKAKYHIVIPLLILVVVGLNTLSRSYDDWSGVVFFSLTVFFAFELLFELTKNLGVKIKFHWLYLKNNFTKLFSGKNRVILLSGLIVAVTYLSWHYFIVGNLRLGDLSQFKYSEGNVVELDNFMRATGLFLFSFTITGILCVLIYKKDVFFWVILFFLNMLILKNDLIGIKSFMDRFIVYVMIFMIPLAAFAIEKILSIVNNKTDKK